MMEANLNTIATLVPEADIAPSGVSKAATKALVLENQVIARAEILNAAKILRENRKDESVEFQALYEFVEATLIYLEAELEQEGQ